MKENLELLVDCNAGHVEVSRATRHRRTRPANHAVGSGHPAEIEIDDMRPPVSVSHGLSLQLLVPLSAGDEFVPRVNHGEAPVGVAGDFEELGFVVLSGIGDNAVSHPHLCEAVWRERRDGPADRA